MLSDEFRQANATELGDPDEVIGYKRARPFQLANLFQQLTGYEWLLDPELIGEPGTPLSMARSSFLGFEVLAGGHDSYFQTEPDRTVNVTTSLFVKKMATDAASWTVEQDFEAQAEERRLLQLVAKNESSEAAIRDQLVWLFRRLYGQRVETDDASVDDAYAIFSAVHERTGSTQTAWKATLTAMLQDLHIVFY